MLGQEQAPELVLAPPLVRGLEQEQEQGQEQGLGRALVLVLPQALAQAQEPLQGLVQKGVRVPG